jgi:hypothetical protein
MLQQSSRAAHVPRVRKDEACPGLLQGTEGGAFGGNNHWSSMPGHSPADILITPPDPVKYLRAAPATSAAVPRFPAPFHICARASNLESMSQPLSAAQSNIHCLPWRGAGSCRLGATGALEDASAPISPPFSCATVLSRAS